MAGSAIRGEVIEVMNVTSGIVMATLHDLFSRQREILLAGGSLNSVKNSLNKAAA